MYLVFILIRRFRKNRDSSNNVLYVIALNCHVSAASLPDRDRSAVYESADAPALRFHGQQVPLRIAFASGLVRLPHEWLVSSRGGVWQQAGQQAGQRGALAREQPRNKKDNGDLIPVQLKN